LIDIISPDINEFNRVEFQGEFQFSDVSMSITCAAKTLNLRILIIFTSRCISSSVL